MPAFAGAIYADGSAIEIDQPEGCGPSAFWAQPAFWAVLSLVQKTGSAAVHAVCYGRSRCHSRVTYFGFLEVFSVRLNVIAAQTPPTQLVSHNLPRNIGETAHVYGLHKYVMVRRSQVMLPQFPFLG